MGKWLVKLKWRLIKVDFNKRPTCECLDLMNGIFFFNYTLTIGESVFIERRICEKCCL